VDLVLIHKAHWHVAAITTDLYVSIRQMRYTPVLSVYLLCYVPSLIVYRKTGMSLPFTSPLVQGPFSNRRGLFIG
jgi:hypothetical protein